MTLSIEQLTHTQPAAHLVHLRGRLDTQTVPALEEEIVELLARPEVQHLLFDLSAVSLISSAGLRVLVVCAKAMQKKGGRLALFGPSRSLQEVFDISGLGSILRIFASREEALASG